jgi:hypothetical protein
MHTSKISGLVKNIEIKNDDLSIVTLVGLKGRPEKEVPVYMRVKEAYTGKFVDITTYRFGLFFKIVQNRVESLQEESMGDEMPYFLLKLQKILYPDIKGAPKI